MVKSHEDIQVTCYTHYYSQFHVTVRPGFMCGLWVTVSADDNQNGHKTINSDLNDCCLLFVLQVDTLSIVSVNSIMIVCQCCYIMIYTTSEFELLTAKFPISGYLVLLFLTILLKWMDKHIRTPATEVRYTRLKITPLVQANKVTTALLIQYGARYKFTNHFWIA